MKTYTVKFFDIVNKTWDEVEVMSLKAARNLYMKGLSKNWMVQIWRKGTEDKLIADSNPHINKEIA